MLPNFIVIGAAKSGTTSIWSVLDRHPKVVVSDPQEPYFFRSDDLQKTFSWCEGLFASAVGKKPVGEGSCSNAPDFWTYN